MPHRGDFTSPEETSGSSDKQEEGGTPGLLAGLQNPSETPAPPMTPQLLISKPCGCPGTSHYTAPLELTAPSSSCSMSPSRWKKALPSVTLVPSHGFMVISGHFCPFLNGMPTQSQALGIKETAVPSLQGQVFLGGKGSLLVRFVPPLCPLGPQEEQASGKYIQHHACNEQQASLLGPSPKRGPGDTELGTASSGLQEAPRPGRAGVGEPDGNGQRQCSGLW